MADVKLLMMKVEGKFTIRMERRTSTEYLGATERRTEIEAFLEKLKADIIAKGDNPVVEIDRSAAFTISRQSKVFSSPQ